MPTFNLFIEYKMSQKFTFITLLVIAVISCESRMNTIQNAVELTQKNTSSKLEILVDETIEIESNIEIIDDRFTFVIEGLLEDELNQKINDLFTATEEKIVTNDFFGWYSVLSEKYKDFINNKDNLANLSKNSNYLKIRKINLSNAEDYFIYIVTPSRKGAALKYKGYKRINKDNIQVECVLDDKLNFVYDFVYQNGSWKLDKK